MTDRGRWSDDAQRYLEGEGPPPPDDGEGREVRRFEAALRAYADGVPGLDAGLDRRIMAAVRARRPRRRAWRWFMEPRSVSLRPALAAAAVVALVAASSAVTLLLERGGGTATARGARETTVESGTVLVRFELRAPGAHRVALAGSFNEWSDSSIVFAPAAEPGVWSVTVGLRPGRYQYLFVVDGKQWIPDPEAHAQVEDEFGQQNSLLVVGPRGVVRS
jgi:hypothetical protein